MGTALPYQRQHAATCAPSRLASGILNHVVAWFIMLETPTIRPWTACAELDAGGDREGNDPRSRQGLQTAIKGLR